MTNFSQTFAMPNKACSEIKPIRLFMEDWIKSVCGEDYHDFDYRTAGSLAVVDPFARNCKLGTITNDLNPNTSAQFHMKAEDFLDHLLESNIKADVVIYDPPYSVRQISECFTEVGIKATQQDTQSTFYTKLKDRIRPLVKTGGVVLSFGWNSMGVGKKGFTYEEIMLVTHGGIHNDTICVAQRKD